MSNFKSPHLVSLADSVVISFNINGAVKQYSLGFSASQVSSETENKLLVQKNNITSINNQGNENSTQSSNGVILSNVQNFLLGYKNIIIQQKDDGYYVKKDKISNTIDFYNTSTNIKTNLEDLDLDYHCFTKDSFFSNNNEQMYYINNQYYYKTNLEVTPILYETDNDEYITVSNNQDDLFLLGTDFEIFIPNSISSKITTIISYQKINNEQKIVKTQFIKDKKFDRARFVISDYGRTISHSIKNTNEIGYSNTNISNFDCQKYTNPVSIKFYTSSDSGISNITANF